jgi:hypothetical protein
MSTNPCFVISGPALQAMAMFTAGSGDAKRGNPAGGVHFSFDLDGGIMRIAATNGKQMAMFRATNGESFLKEVYWPEGLSSVSFPVQLALPAIAKMGAMVKVQVGESICTFMQEDPNGLSVTVPRIHARQLTLFDDLENLPKDALGLQCRGQVRVNPLILAMFAKAAKKLGIPGPDRMDVANLGTMYGITFAGSAAFWGMTTADESPESKGGLPPVWVIGEDVEATPDPEPTITVSAGGKTVETTASALGAAIMGVIGQACADDGEEEGGE